jgi:hypothetical protein
MVFPVKTEPISGASRIIKMPFIIRGPLSIGCLYCADEKVLFDDYRVIFEFISEGTVSVDRLWYS